MSAQLPASTSPQASASADDQAYQKHILQGVSRTFALTIPQLPDGLRDAVSNAYLLCRIADTIEDDNALDDAQTREFSDRFIRVVEGTESAAEFADALYPLLSEQSIEAEHDLIRHTPAVMRITHSFNPVQQQALQRCIRIMAHGMADYQDAETPDGLKNLAAMDDYCYYVAGVVGEMLTDLFCDYSTEINQQRGALMSRAVSFGQGLQMTNILKDIWDDQARGACWLPQDIFAAHGVELRTIQPGSGDAGFENALGELIAVAADHLRDALDYTLLIPAHEKGIRRFCLWAIGMAVLTLDKLNSHRDFADGSEVKISRNSVKATIFCTNLLVSQDRLLKMLFNFSARKLPRSSNHARLRSRTREA